MTPWKIGLLLLLVITAVIGGTLGALIWFFPCDPAWAVRAAVGQSFGVVNAITSALAFAGVIYALVLQSRQTRLLAEQIEQQRQSHIRAKQKEARINAPFFNRRGGSIAGDGRRKVVEFQNIGGRISQLNVKSLTPEITVEIQPSHLIDRDAMGAWVFSGADVKRDIEFELSGFDLLGNLVEQKYRVPSGTTNFDSV